MKKYLLILAIAFTFSSEYSFAQASLTNSVKLSKNVIPNSILNLDFGIGYMPGNDSVGSSIHLPVKIVIGSGNNGVILAFQGGGTSLIPLDTMGYDLARASDGSSESYVYQTDPYATTVTGVYYMGSYKEVDPSFLLRGSVLKLGYQKSLVRGLYANLTFDICKSKYIYNYRHDYLTYYNYDYGWGESSTYTYTSEYTYDQVEVLWGVRSNLGIGYTLNFLKNKKAYLNAELSCAILNRSKQILNPYQVNFGLGFRIGTPATTTYEGVKNVTTVPVKP